MGIINKIKAIPAVVASCCAKICGKKLKVMSTADSINKIVNEKLSVVRYGDGELVMMVNKLSEGFQTYNSEVAGRLMQIARSTQPNVMICVSDIFNGTAHFNESARAFYRKFNNYRYHIWFKFFDRKRLYGNAFLSRPYMDLQDKSPSKGYFDLIKTIWTGRKIVIIEGELSRLGVGNDLFASAQSLERILCPAKNAYLKYNDIIAAARNVSHDKLVLIALGATATVLAYDLACEGYQAIDIGHVDVEYEWMRMGATEKVPIPTRYVNEAGSKGGHVVADVVGDKYDAEIIARIL